MRVLVTGSSGQLGGEIVRQLTPAHDVAGFDRVAGPHTTIIGDVADATVVDGLVRDADAVIHTASLHAPHVPTHSCQAFVDTNITGTLQLLEAATRHRVPRFIYSSTTSVYGKALEPGATSVWVTEDLVTIPRDIYDVTKLAAEQLCRLFSDRLHIICLRVSRFYDEEPYAKTVHRMYRGGDVRDMAAAHLLALEAALGFEIFNISSRSPFLQEDLADLLHDAPAVIDRRIPWARAAFEAAGWQLPASIDRVYVIGKAERLLGYKPKYGLEDMFGTRSG